jgi:hypothetical protein
MRPKGKGALFCRHLAGWSYSPPLHHLALSRNTTTKPTDTHNNRRSSDFKKMASWESFDAVFYFDRNYAHDKKTLDRIVANRRSLQNQLFIDRLLQLMGVKLGSKQRSGHFCLAYLLNNG